MGRALKIPCLPEVASVVGRAHVQAAPRPSTPTPLLGLHFPAQAPQENPRPLSCSEAEPWHVTKGFLWHMVYNSLSCKSAITRFPLSSHSDFNSSLVSYCGAVGQSRRQGSIQLQHQNCHQGLEVTVTRSDTASVYSQDRKNKYTTTAGFRFKSKKLRDGEKGCSKEVRGSSGKG